MKNRIFFNFYLCEFLSSKFNLLLFFLVFAVTLGSGLSGLGEGRNAEGR